jgi:predicted MFS family arabinose efflux permease
MEDVKMSKIVANSTKQRPPGNWPLILAGLCASLVGIGLARFAYTPLLPAIVAGDWFTASDAAFLGAANLTGYLAGALVAAPLVAHVPAAAALRGVMVLATLTFFACAWPVNFTWFFGWRFVSGLSGGVLMVLAAPTVLPHVPQSRRGIASGAIFMGIGLGIAASGTLVPLLLRQGLPHAWIGLGVLSLILTLVAWTGWPGHAADMSPGHKAIHPVHATTTLRALYTSYALNAVGLVPHMIFLVDFVARGLGQGLDAGAQFWVLFGLGAGVGPILSGHLADRTGFGRALRLAYLVQAVAVALPAFGLGSTWLIMSSVVVGAFTPGIVPLVLGRIHELLHSHAAAQKSAWSKATVCFAICQALAAYGMSLLFDHTGGNYRVLFGLGAGSLLLALAIDLVAGLVKPRGLRDA